MLHHLFTDIVSGTDLGVLAVRGAEEIRLFPLVVVGDAVIQLFSAISAVQQARKRTDKSTFCRSTAMLAIPVDIVLLFAVLSECRFSVSVPESHRSVAPLAPIGEVVAESYPIRTVIQLSGRLFALTLINWEFIIDLNEVNFVNFPQTTKRAGTQHIKSAGDDLSLYL